jgi:hypothetical protein
MVSDSAPARSKVLRSLTLIKLGIPLGQFHVSATWLSEDRPDWFPLEQQERVAVGYQEWVEEILRDHL